MISMPICRSVPGQSNDRTRLDHTNCFLKMANMNCIRDDNITIYSKLKVLSIIWSFRLTGLQARRNILAQSVHQKLLLLPDR